MEKQWQHESRSRNLAVFIAGTSKKGMYQRFAGLLLVWEERGARVFVGEGRRIDNHADQTSSGNNHDNKLETEVLS